MRFWKMNGAGNDFVLINNIEERIPSERFPEIARIVCERRLSLGADGIMVVERASEGSGADFRMIYYNADGSLGEMCGNGARCIARYGYENSLAGERQTIETTAGIVLGERISRDLYRIRLNDPGVIDLGREITAGLDEYVLLRNKALTAAASLRREGHTVRVPVSCGYTELGDPGIPHAVVLYEGDIAGICGSPHLRDAARMALKELGRSLRYHPAFPKGANISFVEVLGPAEADIITYERGVEDFTYACGTGTGSAAVILTLMGLMSGSGMSFHMRGGTLIVDIEETDECTDGSVYVHGIMLTGPTNIIARGELTDSALGDAGLL